ncbi:hypothetical protein [Cohnella lupini]|uniref:Molybdopterin-dependent oxidoreductase-like protein n=1 Tax=Cohnella lupini TaxID=1294267 RepID=A0A3D9IR94_9BACL|nr:hypothetical protein [Cohnella lupini]RED64039.1 hypothetical protein DFP95_103280 [Cohnella lupini]
MSVTVILPNKYQFLTDPKAMAELSNDVFPVADRVPGTIGEGFDLQSWYSAVLRTVTDEAKEGLPAGQPTHLTVRAADEFQATIPWGQLSKALFQYAVDGLPLAKGQPIRLYVPDGTSACLNVKSVVTVKIVSDALLGEDATYGFLNEVSPSLMLKGLKSR